MHVAELIDQISAHQQPCAALPKRQKLAMPAADADSAAARRVRLNSGLHGTFAPQSQESKSEKRTDGQSTRGNALLACGDGLLFPHTY